MSSENLQSPYDPDATYRRKLHGRHVGYVGNFLEGSGPNGTVILDYQYEKNVYSDSRFLRDTVFRMGYQQKPCVLVADGGYSGAANTLAAKNNNITLVTTNLTGQYRNDSYRLCFSVGDIDRINGFKTTLVSILPGNLAYDTRTISIIWGTALTNPPLFRYTQLKLDVGCQVQSRTGRAGVCRKRRLFGRVECPIKWYQER